MIFVIVTARKKIDDRSNYICFYRYSWWVDLILLLFNIQSLIAFDFTSTPNNLSRFLVQTRYHLYFCTITFDSKSLVLSSLLRQRYTRIIPIATSRLRTLFSNTPESRLVSGRTSSLNRLL